MIEYKSPLRVGAREHIATFEPDEHNTPLQPGELAAREYLARQLHRRSMGPQPRTGPGGAVVVAVIALLACALGLVADGEGCRRPAPAEMQAD